MSDKFTSTLLPQTLDKIEIQKTALDLLKKINKVSADEGDISKKPESIGKILINNKEAYISVGTSSPSDWKKIT